MALQKHLDLLPIEQRSQWVPTGLTISPLSPTLEQDVLKLALTNEAQYLVLRSVFINHPHPGQLDGTGRELVRIFRELDKRGSTP